MRVKIAGFDQAAANAWLAYINAMDQATDEKGFPACSRAFIAALARDAMDAHFEEVDRRACELWPEAWIVKS